MLKYLFKKQHQKQLDNDLKIALLNYLSKCDTNIRVVSKSDNNPNPLFEECFKFIKSL